MRNLVIDQLMGLIKDGVEVYGADIGPIQSRKKLESMSNRELLSALIIAVEFQG